MPPGSPFNPGNRRAASGERRVTVVHLVHTMAYGGIETIIINWLGNIDPERFDAHLVCFANPGGTEAPFVAAAERAGLCVHRIPWSRRKPILRSARALVKILRGVDAAILHTHNVYADLVGFVAAKMTGVRTVTTLYVWSRFDWRRNLLQLLDRWIIRFFDLVTTQCEATRRDTIARGLRERRTKVLISGFAIEENSLDERERRRRRREKGIADGDVLLVNVARLYPEKAQDFLLRSFKATHGRCPEARLWILGVGPLEAELRRRCRDLGLDDVVTFLGFVDDLAPVLELADIQVHPSHAEGVPLAICAGMAVRLPIVASAVGGLPEILGHGRYGVLVPPGDEQAFTDAVVRLVRDGTERRRIGQAARRFIEEEYSVGVAVKRLEETYLELVESK